MILLFLKPSLALLEAELAPFKDWAKSSSSSLLDHPHNAADENDDDLPNLLTGLTRLPEGLERVLKKGKSSEFNPENYEHVKSSPSFKVWWHESIKDAVKFDKWVNLRGAKKYQKKFLRSDGR